MAARIFQQFRFSLEKMPVDLFLAVSYGATGAPTLDTANSKGVTSMTRTSAGLYVITLADNYNRLLNVEYTPVVATGFTTAPTFQIVSDTMAAGGKTITIQLAGPTAAGNTALTAADPANGEAARMTIQLRNSSAF